MVVADEKVASSKLAGGFEGMRNLEVAEFAMKCGDRHTAVHAKPEEPGFFKLTIRGEP